MILYDETQKIFTLNTRRSTTLLAIGENGLHSLYWGGTVSPEDFYPPQPVSHASFDPDIWRERDEYPIFNGRIFTEPCLIAGESGKKALFFKYQSHEVMDKRLSVVLKEEKMKLTLTLLYDLFEDFDIISRKVILKNDGEPINVSRLFSGICTLPELAEPNLRYLTGQWAGECQIRDVKLEPGVTVLQSRRGIPGPHFNPSFAMYENAEEETGEVWFGLLAYSGNWKISVQKTVFGNTQALAGRNDFDADEILGKGESLDTPAFYTGFSENGFGGMSRKLHDFQRTYFATRKNARPVLYNSWEATYFDVNIKSQMALAKKAADIGVELFVVDDGWFGRRNNDKAGLGDWTVNQEKFPNGLDELIDYVKGLGMEFGIWVEPEAVNPDSDLFHARPDWIYYIPDVEPMRARNQYVLDFSLPEVKEYVKDFLYKLISEHDIKFLKWDMNRPVTDVYTKSGGNGRRRRKHVETLYEIWAWLSETFPRVALESCSGGGGRVDLGILQWASEFWPSDNTDPYERLFIQEGFTQFYAPGTMTCWVTDTPDTAGRIGRSRTAYKFHSSMCGPLGIGVDISKLDDEILAEYKSHIEEYKQIRDTVQFGELYRLSSPRTGLGAVQYSDEKQIVALAFLHSQIFGRKIKPLRLRGLQPDRRYTLSDGRSFSGCTLMNKGIELNLSGDFDSCCLVFR
jgi:alpha-galactosidase